MTDEFAINILEQYREKPTLINEIETVEEAVWLDEALAMGIQALKQKSCEDMISRQAVDTLVDELARAISDERCCMSRGRSTATIMQDILDLPPVTPQPETGHWIQTNEFFINQDGQFIYKFICSECKSLSYFRKSNKKAIGANVCPNCCARMVEEQGSEDKCKNCKYYRNPDYTRCHECEAKRSDKE